MEVDRFKHSFCCCSIRTVTVIILMIELVGVILNIFPPAKCSNGYQLWRPIIYIIPTMCSLYAKSPAFLIPTIIFGFGYSFLCLLYEAVSIILLFTSESNQYHSFIWKMVEILIYMMVSFYLNMIIFGYYRKTKRDLKDVENVIKFWKTLDSARNSMYGVDFVRGTP